MINLFRILLLNFIIGCTQSSVDCQDLTYRSYKGSPRAENLRLKNCQGVEVLHTKEDCQEALKDLMMSSDINKVIQKHGENIDKCFTENDLKKFNFQQ